MSVRKVGEWLDFMDWSIQDEPLCSGYSIDPLIGFDFISPNKKIFRKGTGCIRNNQLELIGSGQSGKVYDTLCNGKRGFVTKIIDIPRQIESLYNELYMQQIANKYGLAPRIIECLITDDNKAIIIMEKIEGKTLSDVLKMDPSGDTLISLVPSIAKVFHKLHSIGIVHRDSHVENIYVQPDNSIIFIDFGKANRMIGLNGKMDILNIKKDYATLTHFVDMEEFEHIKDIKEIYKKFVRAIDPHVNNDLDAYRKKPYKFLGFKFGRKVSRGKKSRKTSRGKKSRKIGKVKK